MNSHWSRRCLLAAWIVLWLGFFAGMAGAKQEQASIEGLLFVSYPGDLSFDVMFGKGVEVLLLDGKGNLEKEFQSLKKSRLATIQAQEAVALKANRELRAAKGTVNEKEKWEAFKREGEKVEKLRSDYEKEAKALLAKHAIQRTETDEKGRFRFQGLFSGRHFLYARFELRGTVYNYFWLHPVELKRGEKVEIELNKAATISLYQ